MRDDTCESRLVLTVPEAARVLGIGRNSAYAAVLRGELPSLRLGRRVLIPRAALEHLVDLQAGSCRGQRVVGEASGVED
ncbi:MAG: helix-turn-helix domain-containing protein [Chloroflexota bacterium]|nr:helix-turn-helix domain-containing protein [Chloroflexota bacterium]